MKYRGKVEARTGILLGGSRVATSIWFDTAADAKAWAEQAMQANQKAGRDVIGPFVDARDPEGEA